MEGIEQAVSLILSLTQAAAHAANTANDIASAINRARSEGRDLTDEELDAAKSLATAARERLAATE